MSNFAAPPVRTVFLGNPPADFSPKNIVSWPWLGWFQAVTTALSQPLDAWPVGALSTSPGTPGQPVRYDANFVYVCVAKDTWKRLPLASF
jgi:hypothetical protein